MEELKKCPFCGGEAKIYDMATDDLMKMAICTKCHAHSTLFWSEDEVVEAWNRRVKE